MTTLYRVSEGENGRVYIVPNAALTPEQQTLLGDQDGEYHDHHFEDGAGAYLPISPERAAELTEQAKVWDETYAEQHGVGDPEVLAHLAAFRTAAPGA